MHHYIEQNTPEFDYIRDLVRRKSGIVLLAEKSYLMDTRLEQLARNEGFTSVTDLLTTMRSLPYGKLHKNVVEAFATKESLFFRDAGVFDNLRNITIPELISLNKKKKGINIWSAACSTGQEPYSVAMLMAENFSTLSEMDVKIIASDFSEQVLQKAKEGVFNDIEVRRGLPAHLLQKYFEKEKNAWRVRDNLRQRITFRLINLFTEWPQLPEFDLVMMRNVLIYFDDANKRRILGKVRERMHKGSYLVVGTGESPHIVDEMFHPIQFNRTVLYRTIK